LINVKVFSVAKMQEKLPLAPLSTYKLRVSLGFHSEVDENCSLLGCYAANSGNALPTFRDNLSVPSSGFKNLLLGDFLPLKMETKGCPETSVSNYNYSPRNNPEERSYQIQNISN